MGIMGKVGKVVRSFIKLQGEKFRCVYGCILYSGWDIIVLRRSVLAGVGWLVPMDIRTSRLGYLSRNILNTVIRQYSVPYAV